MLYLSHTPAAPLCDFVENLWHLEDAPSHAGERIIPSGTMELVVNLREDEVRVCAPAGLAGGGWARHSGAVVSGTYSSFFGIDPRRHGTMLGVHFRPGGAWPFIGAPAGEFADAHVDLEAVWGRSAGKLREQLCAAKTPQRRFRIMERALTRRLFREFPERHGAVRAALRAFGDGNGGGRVRDVARRVGLSQRRFIEVFRSEVGMTPKVYCRVLRFQRALAVARSAGRPEWARLAAECGYFDQSHLVHDFREFCGFGPAECLRQFRVPVKQNHVPAPGA